MRDWKKIIRGSEATEIAEAALVLPLLLTLLLGILWLGRAYNVYAAMNHAAREGARAAAGPCCATCGCTAGRIPPFYDPDQIAQQVIAPILTASRVNTSQITSVSPPPNVVACPGVALQCLQSTVSPSITVCQNVDLGIPSPNPPVPPVCGSAVYFQYNFTFPYAPAGVGTIPLTGEATSRTEQ
ncbi:MAG TPA: TadE/TadG family type IV pilus assembly protein [Terriglobales bacterium]|nr:TadE/TadG family type IV pilus assembly protein [Terriglobales bacterium]